MLDSRDESLTGFAQQSPLARQVILFVTQNEGRFPKRRRDRDPFVKLTDSEIAALEEIVSTAFSN